MEKKIIDILKKDNMYIKHLLDLLNNYMEVSVEELTNCLYKLIKEKKIYKDAKNKFGLVKEHYIIAPLQSKSKGEKFIKVGKEKIIIPPENLHSALKDDIIVVDIVSGGLGNVLEIISRKNS